MTQDEIIEMAREAGFSGSVAKMWTEYFKAFAKLVAAAPQRTWAGLTNGEMIELSEMELGGWDLILEVEAKLKEKNT
jgi:hypothetical protein